MLTSRKQTTDFKNKIIKALEAAPDIKNPFWSEFEIDIMKKYYPSKGPKTLARILQRSLKSIYDKASTLGLTIKK